MARNSTKRLGGEYDLESRGSAFFLHSSSRRQHIYSISIYGCGIMLVLGSSVSYVIFFRSYTCCISGFVSFLANCPSMPDLSSDTRIESVIACPRNCYSRSSSI